MAGRRDFRSARSLYRSFREEKPGRSRRVEIDVPRAAAVIGHVEVIAYVTTHGRKTSLYKHEFAEGSRPLLVAGRKPGQVFLIGGRFKFTGRGITDLDTSGRAIDAPERYVLKWKT